MPLAQRAGSLARAAEKLARELASFPQACMRGDRLSVLEQAGLTERAALENEFAHGVRSLRHASEGVQRFRRGAGRHGSFQARP